MGKTKIKTIDDSVDKTESTGDGERGAPSSARSEARTSDGAASRQDPLTEKTGPSASKYRPKFAKQRSKKYQEAAKLVDPNQLYPLKEAAELAQKTSYSKFPGTVEAHLNTTAKNLRGFISLPYTTGREIRILAFGPSQGVNRDASELAGVLWGNDETIAEIEKGKINFDTIIATPDWMPKLARIAKILGPKGLMPSPKNDTVTQNLSKAVAELKGGKTEYKTQTNSRVIHLPVGRTDQEPEEIATNLKALYNSIGRSKITKITLSASMGLPVKVNLRSL